MIRLSRILTAVLTIFALLCPAPAFAETEAQLRSRLEKLKGESRRAGEAYSRAHWRLDETEVKLGATNKRIKQTSSRLKDAKRRLNTHAAQVYRRDSLDLLDFLLGSASFSQFATRMDLLSRIGESDANVVAEVKALSTELNERKAQLETEREQRARDSKRLRSERDKLLARLGKTEAEFKEVKRKLDRLRSGGTSTRGVAAVAGPNGMVFPVVGSYYYADTWGASRSGGRRRHQGTDIMARNGTPVVAVMSGTVRSKTSGLGGKTIWLTGRNGWQFYYAHLDSWKVTSGSVKAGQVIGTVGSTGNASASAPHLHFQIHPGGGSPVNPYPYLRAME